MGAASDAPPAPETADCVAAWAGDGERGLVDALVALYAIESGQPAIAHIKLAGLREHYGVDGGPAACFELHATLDHQHAAAERALIQPRLADADREALLTRAEEVLRASWRLLDGVARVKPRLLAS